MKRLLFLSLLVTLFFIYPALSQSLTVGVYDNPPMVFYKNGKADGFFIELLEYIAKREGWEIRYVRGTFPELMEKLKEGEIDILPDVAFSQERAKIFIFNRESVFNNWGVVVAKNRIEKITDLNGWRVAGVSQDIYFKNFRKLADSFGIRCTYVEVKGDYGEVLDVVKAGKADAGVVSRIYANLYSKNYGLKLTSVIFSPVDLRFAGAKGRETYLEEIDHNLEILKENQDSIYYHLIGKWTEKARAVTPYWVKYIIASTIFLGFLLAFREVYLKRELSKRKFEIIRINRLLERIIGMNETILMERDTEKLGLKTSSLLLEYKDNVVIFFAGDKTMAFSNGDAIDPEKIMEYECIKSAVAKRVPIQIPPGFHPESCIHAEEVEKYYGYTFPMIYGDEVKGLIFIMSEGKLSAQETRILETLAGDIAYAIHDFELERQRNMILRQLRDNINHMMILVDRIKNPLTVIKGLAELKCEEVQDEVNREISNILKIVREIEKSWLESEKLEKKLER